MRQSQIFVLQPLHTTNIYNFTSADAVDELVTVHDQRVFVVGVDDTALDSDSPCGQQVVASHHSDSHARKLALRNCTRHLFSQDVLDAQ